MLKQIFKRAAASALTTLCFAGSAAADPPKPFYGVRPVQCSTKNHTRKTAVPLTDGENALVRSIFGKAVDTSVERKYFLDYTYMSAATCILDDGKSLEFYGTNYHSDDYSQAEMVNYGTFVHEMTHVWQFQNRNISHIKWCSTYKYALDSAHSFSSYCIEQQAAIVEDYARHFIHPTHGSTRNNTSRGVADDFNLLVKVVEEQFPEAQKTRLALEAKEKAQKLQQPNS